MLGGSRSNIVACIAAAGFGGFLALWLLDFVVIRNGLCFEAEPAGVCVRQWIGAFSGWAAFFAAAVSLPYLVGQYREARKQTRFTVGDEPPTLDVIEHLEDEDKLVIRIVNWNRRAIFVKAIMVSSEEGPEDMNSDPAIWKIENEKEEKDAVLPTQINGWENRSDRPSYARIDLVLLRKKTDRGAVGWEDLAIPFPRDATITARVQMLGNVHRIFDLEAEAFPNE